MIAEGLMQLERIVRGKASVQEIVLPAPDGLPLPDGMDQLTIGVVTDEQGKVTTLDPRRFFEPFFERPVRIKETVTLETAQSVVEYVNRFKTSKTALFVTADKDPSLTAFLDHHGESGLEEDATPGQAGWCQHVATYAFPISRHFRTWLHATERCRAGNLYGQQEFAELLQDRQVDIQTPPRDWGLVPADQLDRVLSALNLQDDMGVQPGQAMAVVAPDAFPDSVMDADGERIPCESALAKLRRTKFGSAMFISRLAVGIEATVGQKFKQSVDPKTGDRSFLFEQEGQVSTKAGRQVTVPDYFLLYVPVFDQADRALLPVRLYYRIRGQEIKWGIELMDVHRLVQEEVNKVAREISEETAVPVFFGRRSG